MLDCQIEQQTLQQQKQQQTNHNNTTTSPQQHHYKNTELRLDHIENVLAKIPSSAKEQQQGDDNHEEKKCVSLDSTYLVGQPFRLFCDITNTYHTGR